MKNSTTRQRIEEIGKTVGDPIQHAGRNVWLAGLGVLATVETRAKDTFDDLVSKGEKREKDVKKLTDQVNDRADDVATKVRDLTTKVSDGVETRFTKALSKVGVPSSNEIQRLIDRVEILTAKVDEIKVVN